jgi:deoxycytidine triphosphate deaminase
MAEKAEEKFRKFKKKDPYTNIAPALLNNADVKKYITMVGIVDPFYEKDLNGITYDIRLEGRARYWYYDDDHPERKYKQDVYVLSKDKNPPLTENLPVVNQIELQPNSITYITLEPFFRIPAYIVARFNLKINQIYRGLLLGTGPIVDPGFAGRLSIPLHNLTHNSYILHGGDTIIAMEFTKTSPNKVWDGTRQDEEEANEKRFSGLKTENRDVIYYVNSALLGNKSSDIVNASVRYSTFKKELETGQKRDNGIIIGGIISLVALIVGLLVPVFSSFNELQRDRSEYQQRQYKLEQSIAVLEQKLSGLENDATGTNTETGLRNRIADLEAANEKLNRQFEELRRGTGKNNGAD